MEKIKKVIFTFTGEKREANEGEWYRNKLGEFKFSTCDSVCVNDIYAREEIEEQWKPKAEEEYYYIADFESGTINGTFFYLDSDYDKKKYASGNCFRTRESAEAKLKEIKEILLK